MRSSQVLAPYASPFPDGGVQMIDFAAQANNLVTLEIAHFQHNAAWNRFPRSRQGTLVP